MEFPNAKKRQPGEKRGRGRGAKRVNPTERLNMSDNQERLERFAAQPAENKYLQVHPFNSDEKRAGAIEIKVHQRRENGRSRSVLSDG